MMILAFVLILCRLRVFLNSFCSVLTVYWIHKIGHMTMRYKWAQIRHTCVGAFTSFFVHCYIVASNVIGNNAVSYMKYL